MKYTVENLDQGQLDLMWSFLQMGHQKANVPALKDLCDQLRQAMIQKTAGQRNDDPKGYVPFGDVGTIVNSIVIETMCLYLSGALDRLEKMQWVPVSKRMPELDPDDPESFRKCLITVPLTMERTGKSHWEVHTAYAKWHRNKRRKNPFVWFDDLPAIVTHWMPLPEPPEVSEDG